MKPNLRRCISCRRLAPKAEFWRIVRCYPSGTIELEQGAGRSAYLCPTPDCLRAAQKKNRLGRSLKAKVSPALYQQLWAKLQNAEGSTEHQTGQRTECPTESSGVS